MATKIINIENGPSLRPSKFYGVRLKITIDQERNEEQNYSTLHFRMYAQTRDTYAPKYYYPGGTITVNDQVLQASNSGTYFTFNAADPATHWCPVNNGGMNPVTQQMNTGNPPPWDIIVPHSPDGSLSYTVKYNLGGVLETNKGLVGATTCSGSETFTGDSIARTGFINTYNAGVLSPIQENKKPIKVKISPYSSALSYKFFYTTDISNTEYAIDNIQISQDGTFYWYGESEFLNSTDFKLYSTINGRLICRTQGIGESSTNFSFSINAGDDCPKFKQLIFSSYNINDLFKEGNDSIKNGYILSSSKLEFNNDNGNIPFKSPSAADITSMVITMNGNRKNFSPTYTSNNPDYYFKPSLVEVLSSPWVQVELINSRGFSYKVAGNLTLNDSYNSVKFITRSSTVRHTVNQNDSIILSGDIIADSTFLNSGKVNISIVIPGEVNSSFTVSSGEAIGFTRQIFTTSKDKSSYIGTIEISDSITSSIYQVIFQSLGNIYFTDMRAFLAGWYIGQSLIRGIRVSKNSNAVNALGYGYLGYDENINEFGDKVIVLGKGNFADTYSVDVDYSTIVSTFSAEQITITPYRPKAGEIVEIVAPTLLPEENVKYNWEFIGEINDVKNIQNNINNILSFEMPNHNIKIKLTTVPISN